MPIELYDCEYLGICARSGEHVVREQLYPDGRGWIERYFPSKAAVKTWLDSLPLPGDDPTGLK